MNSFPLRTEIAGAGIGESPNQRRPTINGSPGNKAKVTCPTKHAAKKAEDNHTQPDLNDTELLISFEDAQHWRIPVHLVADNEGNLFGVDDELGCTPLTPKKALQWFIDSEAHGLAQFPNLPRFFEIVAAELKPTKVNGRESGSARRARANFTRARTNGRQ